MYDDITNEGLAFNADKFFGWSKFGFVPAIPPVPFNYFVNRMDIYYYSNPSSGYGLPCIWGKILSSPFVSDLHLTFINNFKVSQSDNDTIMLSMIVLNPKPYNTTLGEGVAVLKLNSLTSSDFATQLTFISEIKFFIDTGTTLMCMCRL